MIHLNYLSKRFISFLLIFTLIFSLSSPIYASAENFSGGGGGHNFQQIDPKKFYSVQLPILDTLVNVAIANGVGNKEYWEKNKNTKLIDLYNEVVFLYYQKYDMDTSQKGFFHNVGVTINNASKFAFNNAIKGIRDYGITSCVGWIFGGSIEIQKEFVDIVVEAMHNLGWLNDKSEMSFQDFIYEENVVISKSDLLKTKEQIKDCIEYYVSLCDVHYTPTSLRLGYVSTQFNDFIDNTYSKDNDNLYYFYYNPRSSYINYQLLYINENTLPLQFKNGKTNNGIDIIGNRVSVDCWYSKSSENYTSYANNVTLNGSYYPMSVGLINGSSIDFSNLRPNGLFNVANFTSVSEDNPPLREGHTVVNNDNSITYNQEYNVTSSGAVTGGFSYFEGLYEGDNFVNKDNFNADIVINPIVTEIKDYIDVIRGSLPTDYYLLDPSEDNNYEFSIDDLLPHGLINKFPFSLFTQVSTLVSSGSSIGKSPPNLTVRWEFNGTNYPMTLDFSRFNGIIAIIRFFWILILFVSLFWVSYKFLGGK